MTLPIDLHQRALIWKQQYVKVIGGSIDRLGFGFATRDLADELVAKRLWLEVKDDYLSGYLRANWKHRPDFACNPSDTNVVCVVLPLQ